ncbi:hypothetical protein [Paucibacter soli]|uniref:hypothetical protein n=1 Tax=Paucibacter soli TaxID=3133433 RepID=UPI0030A4F41F
MTTYTIELADDEVLVALKRCEGYDDVHPELVSEDAIGDRWPEYRTIHGDALRLAEVRAWAHEDDPTRVISAAQKAQAERDGGASASSVRPYSIALI